MKAFTLAAAGLVAWTSAAVAEIGPLITPNALANLIRSGSGKDTGASAPLVLDIRAPRASQGADAAGTFAAGHIPGAVNAPYGAFRGPEENPGQVPGETYLTKLLQGLGVTAERPVVVVHQGRSETDFGAAARVYWTLKSSGLSELAILNGGVAAWQKAGLAMSTDASLPQKSDFEVTWNPRWTATEAAVHAIVAGEERGLLLDARPESFWAGNQSHSAAARPGTLPQSQYFEHAGWFSDGPAIVDAAAARALAQAEGFAAADRLVSFCNTGHWAATNWFALSELAGIDNVKLYPESMVGWSNAGHEMANVPSLFRNLWNQVRGVF